MRVAGITRQAQRAKPGRDKQAVRIARFEKKRTERFADEHGPIHVGFERIPECGECVLGGTYNASVVDEYVESAV